MLSDRRSDSTHSSEEVEPEPHEHNPEIINEVRTLNTCWAAMTPIEVAFFFILCVAVPFLLAMIIVYMTYSMGAQSGNCTYLCSMLIEKEIQARGVIRKSLDLSGGVPPAYHQGSFDRHRQKESSTSDVSFFGPVDGLREGPYVRFNDTAASLPPTPPPARHHEAQLRPLERDERHAASSDYPMVAALIENLHGDDASEKMCKCMAVVVSKKLALTSSRCVEDYRNMSLRLNSNYWSKGGVIRKIKAGAVFNNKQSTKPTLVALNYYNNEEDDGCLNDWKINDDFAFNKTDGFAFTWQNSFKLPLKKRFKYLPLKKLKIGVKNNKNGLLIGASSDLECSYEAGGPLISHDEQYLLGVHLYTECYAKYVSYYYADLSKYLPIIAKLPF